MYAAQANEMLSDRSGSATGESGRRHMRGERPVGDRGGVLLARYGRIEIELASFGRPSRIALTSNATVIHLVVPLAGTLIVGPQVHRAGDALLLLRPRRTECVWPAGAMALTVRIPVALLQQRVAAAFDAPRRLAPIDSVLTLDGAASGLVEELRAVRRCAEAGGVVRPGSDQRLLAALVAALVGQRGESLFPISRSLQRAAAHLAAHPVDRCAPEALARIAGVTLPTLQRNVRTCLGISLARFIEQARLEWVRTRLETETESRSIQRLADISGYASSTSLTRSYQRLFDETPTQTRVRTFSGGCG